MKEKAKGAVLAAAETIDSTLLALHAALRLVDKGTEQDALMKLMVDFTVAQQWLKDVVGFDSGARQSTPF